MRYQETLCRATELHPSLLPHTISSSLGGTFTAAAFIQALFLSLTSSPYKKVSTSSSEVLQLTLTEQYIPNSAFPQLTALHKSSISTLLTHQPFPTSPAPSLLQNLEQVWPTEQGWPPLKGANTSHVLPVITGDLLSDCSNIAAIRRREKKCIWVCFRQPSDSRESKLFLECSLFETEKLLYLRAAKNQEQT